MPFLTALVSHAFAWPMKSQTSSLWFSGYEVPPTKARAIWIAHLERVRDGMKDAAEKHKYGYFDLGEDWWRQLPTHIRQMKSAYSFVVQSPEWLYDTERLDSEAYRYGLAKVLSVFASRSTRRIHPSDELMDSIDFLWERIDFDALFRIHNSIRYVASLTDNELEYAREILRLVREGMNHVVLITSPNQPVARTILVTILMREFLGSLLALTITFLNRDLGGIPAKESVFSIHELLIRLKLSDLPYSDNNNGEFPPWVRDEWKVIEQRLSELWSEAADSPTQPPPKNLPGPTDRTSG